MRAVDTNILVRLAANDDPKQVAAARSFVASGAWVGQVVLAETIWVLSSIYGLGPGAQIAAIEMFLNHTDLTVENAEVATAALDSFRKNPGITFSDYLVLESARKAGHLPLGTFDRRLAKQTGAQRI